MKNYPVGTTHVIPANPLDYDPKPDFFKAELVRYNEFDGPPVYRSLFWYQNEWKPNNGFCDRHNRRITLQKWLNT